MEQPTPPRQSVVDRLCQRVIRCIRRKQHKEFHRQIKILEEYDKDHDYTILWIFHEIRIFDLDYAYGRRFYWLKSQGIASKGQLEALYENIVFQSHL